MPNSLTTMIKKLRYQGKIDGAECEALLTKLKNHDEKLTEKAYMRGYNDGIIVSDWIPCSERLPEETDDLVLGIDSLGSIRIAEIWDDCGQLKWYADGNYDVPIIAWMPIPPYKGVNENG